MKKWLVLIVTLGCFLQLFSQTGEIRGKVLDATTKETLPFANIFINNTTLGTAADENGHFQLKHIPPGVHELVISYVGYKSAHLSVPVGDILVYVDHIELDQADRELANVEIKGVRDEGWEKQYKKFKKIFLGSDRLAESCEILNAYVLDFSKGSEGSLVASAEEPIEISNMALGYKLRFHLTDFRADNKSYIIKGQVFFSEISTRGGITAMEWMENRRKSYVGSAQHLFKSILENQIQGQGFYLYTDKPGPANTSYRSSNFYAELGNKVIPYDTLGMVSPGEMPNTYRIAIKGRLEVHNRNEVVKFKTYNDVPYPVSWIEVEGGYVVVNRDGTLLNPSAVVTSGEMNNERVAAMLPLNYQPDKVITVKREPKGVYAALLEEKVYVHTDKPYYYPGEMMWYKVYMNYRYPHLRDSMSKTLYIELINPQRKIVRTQTLRMENGFAYGNWIVSDTLSSGNYYLRAYTNLNRNFSPDKFFVKPIPVLAPTQRIDDKSARYVETASRGLSIRANKSMCGSRDSIALSFSVRDSTGNPVRANLSVSVTDARQVVPVQDAINIEEYFSFTGDTPMNKLPEIKYPVEYGIGFMGQYFNKKGKPDKAILSILQGNYEHLSVIETDEQGKFWEGGLVFYDSTEFHFQLKDAKVSPKGKVILQERGVPEPDFVFPHYNLTVLNTEVPQRIISEYEVPRGARLLDNVLIRGEREVEDQPQRPYGKPDYVVRTEDLDLSTNNLLIILQGKIPGMVIRNVADSAGSRNVVRITRASNLTFLAPTEPLVMMDGIPMVGSAGDILQSIDATTVETIEVTVRTNPLFGSQGVNGVIAIFTRRGVGSAYIPPQRSIQVVKVQGYSRPDKFLYPDYANRKLDHSKTDYRSILYWNPQVNIDETGGDTVSFYTSDLQTRYRVVVEGITEDNQPVRGVYYIRAEGEKP